MKLFRLICATAIMLIKVFQCAICFSDDSRVSHPGSYLDQKLNGTTTGMALLTAPVIRPVVVLSYPVHAVSWHIVGSSETRGELINHLLTHPEHGDVRAIYSASDLNAMSRSQLLALHDDSHNRRVVNVKMPKPRKVITYVPGNCPGGYCPTTRYTY